jgi:hypothetical protein
MATTKPRGRRATAKPKTITGVPPEAIDWVRSVFAHANRSVTGLLSTIPTHHEPELDMALLAALNQAPPIANPGGWTVYIQTHFLGGRRHFYNWEVADIGFLVIFRDRGKVLRIKVGLLQSKRLYPIERKQLPDFKEKFQVGFATLLKTPEAFRVLASGRTFSFTDDSAYAAMAVGDEQEKALAAYSKMSGIPVYYLLYNPARIPWTATVPATKLAPYPNVKVGCRVVGAAHLRTALAGKADGYHPTFGDVIAAGEPFVGTHRGGWRLEHFVADLLMQCREGHVVTGETDHVLENLFYRRSGPIAAAIAVTVEAPEGVEFVLPELPSRTGDE